MQHTICLVTLHTTQRSSLSQSSRRQRSLVTLRSKWRAVLKSGRILPIWHPRVSSRMYISQRSTTARRYGVTKSVILRTAMQSIDIQETRTQKREDRARVWNGSTAPCSNGTNLLERPPSATRNYSQALWIAWQGRWVCILLKELWRRISTRAIEKRFSR